MALASAPKRRNRVQPELSHAQSVRGRAPVGLLDIAAGTLPGNEGSARGQKRGRVLDEHRQGCQRAGGHQVVRPDALRPFLGASLDRLRVGQLQPLDRPAEKGDLAPDALDEDDARVRKRNRQDEAGKPATGAEIGDPLGTANLGQLERDERVGDVHIYALGWIPNRRDRARLGRSELEQQRQPIRRRGPQAVAIGELSKAGRDLGAHGHGGMQAASARCGRSPRGASRSAWPGQ